MGIQPSKISDLQTDQNKPYNRATFLLDVVGLKALVVEPQNIKISNNKNSNNKSIMMIIIIIIPQNTC